LSETLKTFEEITQKGESLYNQVKGFLHELEGQSSNFRIKDLEGFPLRFEALNIYGDWEEVICLHHQPPKIKCFSMEREYFLAESGADLEGAKEFIANALAHFVRKCGIIEKEVSDMPTSEFSPQIFE